MKFILPFAFCLLPFSFLQAASPSYTAFNANQFGTNSQKVVIKSGALLTNAVLTAPNLGAATATSLSIGGSDVTTSLSTKENLLVNSAGLAAALSNETGTGLAVFATSPSLNTPNIGEATATSLDTGQGANELFDMDQNVDSSASPTFAGLTTATLNVGTLNLTNALGTAALLNDAVTYAKIQNVSAASRLLGRGSAAGAGDVEEITLSGLSMVGTVLTATAGSGDFVGPASSTDNAILRFDSTTGKLGQNSLWSIDDTGNGILGDASAASMTMTFNLSGANDPVATIGNATFGLNSQFTDSFTSIASTPAGTWTGAWFTGGSATTTKPHLLIEPTGATSANWSTAGTGLGVNAASGFAGHLINAQLNGVTRFFVTSTGASTFADTVTAANFLNGAGGLFYWSGRSQMSSASDGTITFRNNAQTDFTELSLGPDDASPGTATAIQPASGVGTDIAATMLQLNGGQSTGTGASGGVSLRTAFSAKSTGSTANTLVDRIRVVAKGKVLTDATAVSLFEVLLPTLTMCGGKIEATIICSNGTDMQSFTQSVQFTAVNKGAAYTIDIDVIPTDLVSALGSKSVSAGTLTTTWTVLTGTDKVTIQLNADTSLTPSSNAFLVYYTITNNSEQAITVL